MKILRKCGNKPYQIILLHGGPGGGGELKSVAEELSKDSRGVLEPILRGLTIDEQINEIRELIDSECDKTVILIGHSWGAMLGFILAGRHPEAVKKLIMVSSGVFEAKYSEQIMPTRMSRLTDKEKDEINFLMREMKTAPKDKINQKFSRLGELAIKTDSKDLMESEPNDIQSDAEVYAKVWGEAEKMRRNGDLLKYGKKILCPVVAIHGDYDPHPIDGIQQPLEKVLSNFKIIILKDCGHYPWLEKAARDKFFQELNMIVN